MTAIATFANQKGGVGKTGASVSVAVCASQSGLRVTIIDIDEQASANDWGCLRHHRFGAPSPPHVIRSSHFDLEVLIRALHEQACDLVIIDTPGTLGPMIDEALRLADLVIVPCLPSLLDLRAARATLTVARRLNRRTVFLLNKVAAYGSRTQSARDYLEKLQGRWFLTALVDRDDHRDAIARGLGVTEHAPAGKAAAEIKSLWDEIRPLLDL